MRTTFTMGIAAVLFFVACSGCSTYAVSRYSASVDNVTALRKLNVHQIEVGNFTMKDDSSSRGCRAVGPIKTPDGEPYSQYVRKALMTELKMAEVYAEGAPITLTGSIDHLDFSSTSGTWEMGLTVSSSNGKNMHVDESYEFSSSFFGETACNQTAQAFMPGVQDLLGKIVRDPGFKALVNAEAPQPKASTADTATTGAKRKH